MPRRRRRPWDVRLHGVEVESGSEEQEKKMMGHRPSGGSRATHRVSPSVHRDSGVGYYFVNAVGGYTGKRKGGSSVFDSEGSGGIGLTA